MVQLPVPTEKTSTERLLVWPPATTTLMSSASLITPHEGLAVRTKEGPFV